VTPGARIQAAIDILDLWQSGAEGLDWGLDRVLAGWGRANRYAGSGDRRAIGDLFHDAVRRLRSAAWVAGEAEPADGRALMIGSLRLDGHDPAALFTGERHAPAPLTAEECAGARPLDEAPRAVRLDIPDWLAPHLAGIPDDALEALRRRAGLFLRVNTLKGDPETAIAALAAEEVAAEPGPHTDTCLRVMAGAASVARSRAYGLGLVEIQDAASQAAAAYARARPGETVLDFCAGGGGKTLALAAAMQCQGRPRGRLHAHDSAPERLAQLDRRARRAGATVTCHPPGRLDRLRGTCDLVFVDAPCSGSGAWRRNPDAKWRLTRERLHGLIRLQAEILAEAAGMVRPGGRLIYATCSILPAENEDRTAAFLTAAAAFRPGRAPLRLLPGPDGDGFFAAELLRDPL
jgi:16S rRNA (cytosine967-C5)-methyltransferase